MQYVTESECPLFSVYSEEADVDYYVYIWVQSFYWDAIIIAEEAFSEWLKTTTNVKNGYIDCVADALKAAGIEASYYDKVREDVND